MADPAESAMCRLGKIVLGFAALILPSLKATAINLQRAQSAESCVKAAKLPGYPVQHEGNRQQQSRWSVA